MGIISSGAITLHNSWRSIYYIGAILIGLLLLLIVFTFPETAYNRVYTEADEKGDIYKDKRDPFRLSLSIILDDEKTRLDRYYARDDTMILQQNEYPSSNQVIQNLEVRMHRLEAAVLGKEAAYLSPSSEPPSRYTKTPYWRSLRLFSGQIYTQESFWRMFVRPFGLILLPPVIWATLVMSVLIGFAVALSSIFAQDFGTAYGFTSFQSGLCFFGSLVGGILASKYLTIFARTSR